MTSGYRIQYGYRSSITISGGGEGSIPVADRNCFVSWTTHASCLKEQSTIAADDMCILAHMTWRVWALISIVVWIWSIKSIWFFLLTVSNICYSILSISFSSFIWSLVWGLIKAQYNGVPIHSKLICLAHYDQNITVAAHRTLMSSWYSSSIATPQDLRI